ncbi:uncharacterized protein LOC9636036 isoform X3 [Selaginella moellendorffii]|nr:uncharacterized protein LOC9636036 isoform X3 [Selaginella moellendorffii]|eukprot:XP_002965618.2 uncharacterized protein LOC9636036 isoform X3 [Selaginella moellendorffii]
MRQVFAVDGGRSCRIECRNLDRKRSRSDKDRESSRHGGYSSMPWEDEEDELGWDEEDELEFQSFQKSLGNRSVSWTGGGMTIRARNSNARSHPENGRESYQDGYGRDSFSSWERKQLPRYDPYDLWDSEEDSSPKIYDNFEDDYLRARTHKREDYRYDDLGGRPMPPPRSLGGISARRHYSGRESPDFYPPAKDYQREDYQRVRERQRSPDREPYDYYASSWRDHHDGRKDAELLAAKARARSEEDLPPGFERKPESKRSPSPGRHDERDRRSCFNCGKVGHLSAQCPLKTERGERSPKRLRPSEDDRKRGRGKQCYNCGEEGHKSRVCPRKVSVSVTNKEDGGRRADEKRCFNCHESGHLLFECPMFSDGDAPRNESARSAADNACVLYKTKLTDAEKNQYLRQNKCFTCGKSGHPYYSCPQSEKRLEYVFEDREHKSALKLLKSACWNYWDDNGEMHGPVSLSFMSTRLQEGIMDKNVLVRHMYEHIKPIPLETLLKFSKSKTVLSLLGCMPESASFLGEEMDAQSCVDKSLSAFQNKLHFDIYETTVRWFFISSMNEALQTYKTARKYWGKQVSQTAEDYSDPDGSGPPHSSDCELSSPDGVQGSKEMEGHSQKSAMLVECCEKYVTDSTLEDPMSNSLAAIQKCIHSGVLEAARGGIVDAIVGEYLHTWDIERKAKASQKEPVIEVIETTSVIEDWTYEKAGRKEKAIDGEDTSEMESSPCVRKNKDRKEQTVEVIDSTPAMETSLVSWRINRLKERAERAVESAAAMATWTKEPQEENLTSMPNSPVVEIISEDSKHEHSEDSKATADSSPTPVGTNKTTVFKRLKRNCPSKAVEEPTVPAPDAVDLDFFMPYEKKRKVPEPRGGPLKVVIKSLNRSTGDKKTEVSVPTPAPVLANEKTTILVDEKKKTMAEPRSCPLKVVIKNSRKTSIPAPAKLDSIQKKKVAEPLKAVKESIPASAPANSVQKKKVAEPLKVVKETIPPAPTNLDSVQKKKVAEPVKVVKEIIPPTPASVPAEKKNTVSGSEPPQLVLKVFRKTKKPNDTTKVTAIPLETDKAVAKKRTLKLTELTDAKASESETKLATIKEQTDESSDSTLSEEEEENEGSPLKSLSSKRPVPAILLQQDEARQPQLPGCARSSLPGSEWKLWKTSYESYCCIDRKQSRAKERAGTLPSARSNRAGVRKLGGSRAMEKMRARKKLLKFQRSKIHAWGVVAMEFIEPEDFIVEYVGEVLRPKVADVREVRYLRQGLGSSYFFRVGDGFVIDATQRGGLGRFINHSCEPNCYAKIITVEGQKRVFIYARTHIAPGTELTYDYKFPHEDQKIPCLCGAERCRGFLN